MSPSRLIICALLIAGCGSDGGGGHAIDTSKYSRACVADSDCVAVYQGTLTCCGGGCPNTAIAASEYAGYAGAFAASVPTCNPQPPCGNPTAICGDKAALCVGSLCTLAVTSTSALSASPSARF